MMEELRKLQEQLHSQACQSLDLHRQIVKVRGCMWSCQHRPSQWVEPYRPFSLETRGLLSLC